ncbi:MAG: hypothetical protein H6668_07125 [Ardenticatenaceae bacterium]|nr:hypothetical protein [Ardenticatenaceae bacterium]
MKANWIPTNEYYDEVMAAADANGRLQTYQERFIVPWQQMMQMVGVGGDDVLAGARAWAWLLPEQLTAVHPTLQALKIAQAWETGAAALAKGVAQFAPHSQQIGMDSVEGWLIAADPARADPINRGYTGAIDFMAPRLVVQYDTPTTTNLRQLPGAIVHELNHLVRLRLFPWNIMTTSVADYIIHEGLAESFAVSLFGEEALGYYVAECREADLAAAKSLVQAGLDKTGFNVIRSYIFGDTLAAKWGFEKTGMPDFGGYAVGYHIVQAYLRQTGKTATDATFVAAQEIIAQSGFLEA